MLTNTERQQIVEEVNAGTYGIDEALDDIAAAQKGEEVRKALYAEALVLNREGHAGSTDMIARQQIANLQTSVNGQISTLRTEVGDDIDDLETALNSGLATQNGRIAAQNATIANVVANYNVEYGSTELWASTGETGALAAGTTVTLSEDVSHFDYVDIYSFCGNSNVLDTVPVDAKLQSSQGYALRWVNLSDPDSGSYKAYVRIIETRLHIIGTTLTIDHQVTYRNGEEVNISGAEITQSNRSTYMGELGIMKVVGRKIAANTEIEDVRIGADGTAYNSAGQAVRAQVTALESAIPAVDSTLSTQGAAADAKVAGDKVAELKSAIDEIRSSGTKNLFNDDVISIFDGISFSDGVFSGAANKFNPNILMQTGFDPNTQYTISLYGKNTGAQTTGYGLGIKINYTNETYGTSFFQNSQTGDFGRLVVLSAAGRTISSVQFEYNSGGDNVWNVKNIQIEKGTSATDYVPYFTGYDRIAREKADNNANVISAVETDLDETNAIINKIETTLGKSANLFDKASAENGKYYSGTIGNAPELKPNVNFCAILIDVKPNTVYTRNFADFASYEVNETGLVTYSRSAATFTTAATTKAITISVSLTHKDDFMIVEGADLPSSYEPYGTYANIPEQARIYEVGTGKPFTTFTACLESLQGHAEQKTILVYDGTYDIFEEIGGADYAATIPSGANWRDVSVVVPPNTKIIGVGDVVFEFLPESSEMPAPARRALSALNVSGNVEVENIKIKARNCRYCIHDETSSIAEFNNVTHKYKNVECIKYSGDGDAQAYAAGFQQGGKYDFDSCLFKSEQGKAFSMHNSSTGGATINIKNCVMITTTATVAVDFINVSGQQVRNITNLCECYFENSGGTKRLSITGGSVNTFDVTCLACTDVGDTTVDIAGNIYPIKQYNKFSVT